MYNDIISDIWKRKRMDYKKWIEEAKNVINTELQIGDIFEAKSLFEPFKWNELKKGEKTGFGIHFSNEVKEGTFHSVKFYGKAKNNHNLYIKYKE